MIEASEDADGDDDVDELVERVVTPVAEIDAVIWPCLLWDAMAYCVGEGVLTAAVVNVDAIDEDCCLIASSSADVNDVGVSR